ncbi:hypothetical protein HGI30_20565 [Paenibacillus albicereus]|uniref:B12-binding domain-containing protein n=1 Tax=Paenibacillus albicereus TaxID=2726185 RepID=A0A6H2H209_9BACL|nr:cobalamin-dependent protein [Paenibacillus albicereus]QJC53687.1 hypothetical protein HGI30_20565 [Paenibacillus albicereus]
MSQLVIEDFSELLLSGNHAAAQELVRSWMDRGANQLSLFQQLFAPALAHIGGLGASGRISAADEQLACGVFQWLLCKVEQPNPEPPRSARKAPLPRAMLLGVEGEEHDHGLRMAASLFRERGWDTRQYGASLTLEQALASAIRWSPDLVCLTASKSDQLPALRTYAESFCQLPAGPAVLVSGRLARLLDLQPLLPRTIVARDYLELYAFLAETPASLEAYGARYAKDRLTTG